MYSSVIVDERLALARAEFGFIPSYSSVEEVDAFNARLIREGKFIYDDTGRAKATQNLSLADYQFILSQQLLCQCDAVYWLTRFAYIKTEENIIKRFSFRVPQRLLFDIIADLEERRVAIELIILKARQLGLSTLIELLIAHRIIFSYGINAVIGSADQTKTGLMANMLFLAYDMCPPWLVPAHTRRVESDRGMLVFGSLASGVSFQHGAQTSGIARGTTPTLYHLCLSGRTLVRVGDSGVKPIKELSCNDKTVSLLGEVTPIKNVHKSPRKSELTSEISVWGTPSTLSCTRDHRVLTEAGWKEAKDITNSDWLVQPVRAIKLMEKIVMDDFLKWKHRAKGVKEFAPTFELGRLVGLYLAEGSIYYSKRGTPVTVGFSIHQDEDERIREWVEAVFGSLDRMTERRKNSKTAVVSLGHRGFANWIIANVGTKDDKRIPDLFWRLGADFCRGVVFGYLAGDGHYTPASNEIYATSVRVAITIGIRDLIASLGHGWSQISFREAGEWHNRNCRQCWMLVVAGETAVSLRNDFGLPTIESKRNQSPLHWKRLTPVHLGIQVESVGEGYSEEFYDVEVADSHHAFVTPAGIVHNSECASFSDPVNQIESSLFKAVHASPGVFGCLEGTGEGDKGWWPDTYRHAKANWEHHRSRLCSRFLPWFCGTDIYPTSTWLRMRPVPPDWIPHRDTRLHVAKAELYVHSDKLLSRHLGANYRMPINQQWFWEVEHEQAKAKNIESVFLQEMAGDDEEALQRSSESVFGHETISTINLHRKREYECFTLTGQSIEESHEVAPEYFDRTRERVPVKFTSNKNETYRWELIPLRPETLRESEPEDVDSILLIFHHPRPGVSYSIGVDTSEGKGQDSTVISVWTTGRRGESDIQCAEFSSSHVNHVEAFAFVLAIAAYYKTYMTAGVTRWKEPYLSIEQVAAVGDTCQLQLARMGYSNFHRMARYDSSVKRIRRQKLTGGKRGWFTFSYTRAMLTGNFVHASQNGWAEINSPWLIGEMKEFEVHVTSSGKEKLEHADDSHDDRIFAAAMAIFCPHDLDVLANRSKKRFVEQTALPPIDLSPYRGNVVSSSDLQAKNIASLDDILYGDSRLERLSK